MTTGTINGYTAVGYTFGISTTALTIATSGTVNTTAAPSAVYDARPAGTLVNYGGVSDSKYNGVEFRAGGTVINQNTSGHNAVIQGYNLGVYVKSGAGTVTNSGTISAPSAPSEGAASRVETTPTRCAH
jgi:hypothetical protein